MSYCFIGPELPELPPDVPIEPPELIPPACGAAPWPL